MRPCAGDFSPATSSASKAMMPPSPRLSARMIRIAYFTETIRITAHRITESTPSTASGDGAPPAPAAFAASLRA